MFSKMIYILLILLHCAIQRTFCFEKQITVKVEPLKEDCYFQPLKEMDELQVEYQVIDGGYGDLDISFYIMEPKGRLILADFKKAEKRHNIEIKTSGDYKICFDNTFSSFNTKTVFLELAAYNTLEDQLNVNSDISFEDSRTDFDAQQIESFYEAINTIRNYLSRARTLQDLIKVTEAKDRNIAEEMYLKVNAYSMFVLVLMMFVSFIQILMVKSIFDDRSKIYKMLCFLDVTKK